MAKKPAASSVNQHHCGRCTQSFKSRQALKKHLSNHSDSEPASYKCSVCPFYFDDSLALEQHCILSGHLQTSAPQRSTQYACDRCPQKFNTQKAYKRHREFGKPCCDAYHASDWKKKPCQGYVNLKKPPPGYIDLDKPQPVRREEPALTYGGESTGTPSDMSEDGAYCRDCKKTFPSWGAHARHVLGCNAANAPPTPDQSPETSCILDQGQSEGFAPASPTANRHTLTIEVPRPCTLKSTTLSDASQPMPLQTVTLNVRSPVYRQSLRPINEPNESSPANVPMMPAASHPAAPSQAAAPSPHQTDAHGVGGSGLDLHGNDSWILGQCERERLQAEGLLRIPPTGPARGGNGNRGGRAISVPGGPSRHAPAANGPYGQTSPRHIGVNALPPLPTSHNIGGVLEMEQAKTICGKTLRLLLQTDIFIHHDGKMSVSGNEWTRIGVERQPAVVGMFDEMCHLPRKLQSLEYVPAPKAFVKDYTAQYPVTEFECAPARNPSKPGVGTIALACSKIVLAIGCQEVVKIAAVDVLTCRILMSHLVCTDSDAQVSNWCSSVTGLTGFRDMEDARQAGFKILKGWAAARAALFRFIDKDTIIVGHNLRSDLDALRIIHGRAVDIAKVIEKAAQGPLSKVQVGLDSWCREDAKVAQLKTDPVFGRDCLTNAFAAREVGLWAIKNREKLEQVAKQKTREYQMVNPVRA